MRPLCAFFAFVGLTRGASDDPARILDQVRLNVVAQLQRSANYVCVQTTDRTYLNEGFELPSGCAYPSNVSRRKLFMRDRLRLDVAVSEGREIYSWHGENKFSSGTIAKIVENGPISSGNFIGFLQNIFLHAGIQFSYSAKVERNGAVIHRFKYVVPLPMSTYHVQAANRAPIVAFHGSFGANATDFQLTDLQVITDSIPADSNICRAETDVKYQLVNISGTPSLIPAVFLLRMETQAHLHTVNRNEYSQCREFGSESTLLFDLNNAPAEPESADTPAAGAWLPPGLTLPVRLQTPVDDRKSYTGDPVEGVLLEAVHVPGTGTTIPKDAILHGVIARLEHRYAPWKHYLVSIEFERLKYGNTSFRLAAWPKTTQKTRDLLSDIYGGRVPADLTADAQQGTLALESAHVHLDNRFSAEWTTRKPPADATDLKAQ